MKKIMHIFMPAFENYSGHEVQFINTLSIFSKKKKIVLNYILPKINKIVFKNKKFKIINGSKEDFFFDKLKNIITNFFVIQQYLKKNISKRKKNILYFDGFSFYFLISLSLVFYKLDPKAKISIITWVRYPYNNFFKKKIFKIFLSIINNK